VSLWTAATL